MVIFKIAVNVYREGSRGLIWSKPSLPCTYQTPEILSAIVTTAFDTLSCTIFKNGHDLSVCSPIIWRTLNKKQRRKTPSSKVPSLANLRHFLAAQFSTTKNPRCNPSFQHLSILIPHSLNDVAQQQFCHRRLSPTSRVHQVSFHDLASSDDLASSASRWLPNSNRTSMRPTVTSYFAPTVAVLSMRSQLTKSRSKRRRTS